MTLADRVEQADGPSRELDLAISTALNTGRSTDPRNPGPMHYTASIDAAMTLVPGGWWPELKGPRQYLNIPTPAPNYWSASVEGKMGWGATPALALCAAALRAREAGDA